MAVIILILVLVISLLLFYFSWSISLGVYLRCVCHRREIKDAVALTYDDGVDSEKTIELLDLLDKWGAKATFCIIGSKAQQNPEVVQRIAKDGHTIVNHSMNHKANFSMQKTSAILSEIESCNAVLEQITGEKVKYFRPPFGVTNPMIGKAVRQSGKIALGWSIRSYDTMGHSVKKVVNRIISQIKGGDIILLHDNRKDVLEITKELLTYINDKGYRAVSIEQLLNE